MYMATVNEHELIVLYDRLVLLYSLFICLKNRQCLFCLVSHTFGKHVADGIHIILDDCYRLAPHRQRFGPETAEVDNFSLLYEFASVHKAAKIPVSIENSSQYRTKQAVVVTSSASQTWDKMAGLVNVNRSNPDVFYRYKMPKLIAKVSLCHHYHKDVEETCVCLHY